MHTLPDTGQHALLMATVAAQILFKENVSKMDLFGILFTLVAIVLNNI
jgi:multidrug transporter EmrE-like cation transporter